MNKKFLSAILFGALMITSTGTFVSCKDYDDDIDQINQELADLESQIAALQNKVNSGEWVSGVTSTANGVTITLGNGQTFNVTNGKDGANGAAGVNGKDGATPKIAVNDEVIQVSYDDGATWTDLVALADLQGEAAAEPIFSVGEDGHIYVQLGEDGEKKDLGVSTGGIYYVEDGPAIILHVCDKDGNWKDIVLPQTAAITSIQALNIAGNVISAGPAVANVTYTIASDDGEYLDGTAFKAGAVLTTTNSKVVAQINPTMADASKYEFYLTNSEGASIFTTGTAKAYQAEGAISRAATVKKGIYELPIQVVAGTKVADLTATAAYAIATEDAYGNEVLSNYDVKVNAVKATTSSLIVPTSINVVVGEEYDFVAKGDVTEKNLVDVKYYFAEGETAAVAAAGATISGSVIKGTVAGKSVTVSAACLNHLGKPGTPETFVVNFISKAQTGAASMEWTVNATTVKDSVEVSAYGWADGAANVQLTYKDSNNATQNAPGINTGEIKTYTDKYGYKTQYLIFTFNPSTVKPGTYTAKKNYGDGNRSEFTISVTVKDPAATYDFKPLAAYFNADKTEATAYGVYASGAITYNLYNLFNVKDADKANVYFSETVPARTDKKDNLPFVANKWMASTVTTDDDAEWAVADSIITVDKAGEYKNAAGNAYVFGGAYYARQISVKYVPFGNANLAPVVYTFNLTVKSEIYEGTLEYVKATYKTVNGVQVFDKYVAGDVKEINGNTVTLAASEILAKDVYGKTYDFTSASEVRVATAKAVLFDENAKQYLEITGDFATGYTISKKSDNTAIVTPPTCTIQVQIEDQWGKTKTVDVQVVVNK